jgi:hypothetical protein
LPITSFNSFTDGLDANRRSREHFVTNINVDDGHHWLPYADGEWLQLSHFNGTSGGFSVVLKGLPGAMLRGPILVDDFTSLGLRRMFSMLR